jgi:hypothetical protein
MYIYIYIYIYIYMSKDIFIKHIWWLIYMLEYLHFYMCVYIRVYLYVYICVYVHTCFYIHIDVYKYLPIDVWRNKYLHVCMHFHTFVCVYIYICTHIYVYVYIHTWMHTFYESLYINQKRNVHKKIVNNLYELSFYLPFLHSVVIPLTRTSLYVFHKIDIEIDFVTHCHVVILF